MDDFDRAEARAHALASRLLRSGVDAGVVADAFAAITLSLFAAQTGLDREATVLLGAWHQLREATEHGQ
ncbi:hypothetical protein KEU06_13725 [Pseudaminobacter sp. 19-2017]|uniref:Uncharacterized protein n=1 Tax=Pseudaminobacter soli (ex Zhang et al. 2022) TaxID=2831468 RepID=A0A942I2H2_9HYPH|nr:hypothetical protein [Pseudaminobacter soli]MBS3649667.1 hypothetical protein [Pseudaminobacter soli]